MALDTYEEEPLPVDSPLRQLSNVVLSPHVAGQTSAALVRVATSAAKAFSTSSPGAGQRMFTIRKRMTYAHRQSKAVCERDGPEWGDSAGGFGLARASYSRFARC